MSEKEENSNPSNNESSNKIANDFGRIHEWKRVSLMLFTYVSFVIAISFNTFASLLWNSNSKLFPVTTANISDTFYTDFTPAGWTFSIWGFIYTWQGIWLVYTVTCLFRKSKTGKYLYIEPDFLHYGMFIAYLTNMWFNTSWIFLWAYQHLGWALMMIVLMMITLYIGLFISFRKLKENETILRNEGLTKEIWFVRIFVQNGIAFYATWISIASNLNFAIYIIWRLGVNITDAGTVALIFILSAIIVYFILENFIWRHYLLYLFSPWIVIIVALIGSLTKNWNSSNPSRNNIISLIMIIIVFLLIIARIVLFILYKTVLKHRFISFRVSDSSQKNDNVHKA